MTKKTTATITLPSLWEDITWTAIRNMMAIDHPDAAKIINDTVLHLMSKQQRDHNAWDINQNIDWNIKWSKNQSDYELKWRGIHDMFANYKQPEIIEAKLPVKGEAMSNEWFTLCMSCLKYIIHSHSYSSSYIEDMTVLWDYFSEEQRDEFSAFLSENVREDDDESMRIAKAAWDKDNRWTVHAKSTKEQMKKWCEEHKVINNGVFDDLDKTAICFEYDGSYCSVKSYFSNGHLPRVINDFVVSVEHV